MIVPCPRASYTITSQSSHLMAATFFVGPFRFLISAPGSDVHAQRTTCANVALFDLDFGIGRAASTIDLSCRLMVVDSENASTAPSSYHILSLLAVVLFFFLVSSRQSSSLRAVPMTMRYYILTNCKRENNLNENRCGFALPSTTIHPSHCRWPLRVCDFCPFFVCQSIGRGQNRNEIV